MNDRLDWIFEADDDLAERYDRWAETYDVDHDGWGWRGPERAAAALLERVAVDVPVFDAGCGTGGAGRALRRLGHLGSLTGLDLSGEMLQRAREWDVYDTLLQGSLYDIRAPENSYAAIISTGVFTHGHVDGSAFPELIRVGQPGAPIVVTMRLDIMTALMPSAEALVEAGQWRHLHTSEPERFHPVRDDSIQSVVVFEVA